MLYTSNTINQIYISIKKEFLKNKKKVKTLCFKGHKQEEDNLTELGGNICTDITTDKRLLSSVYEELLQFKTKKTTPI